MIPGKGGNYQGNEGMYISELTLTVKLLDEAWPLGPKNISTCEGTITTTHNKGVYSFFDEIVGSCKTTFMGSKSG